MTITRERLTPAPPQGTYLGMPAFPKAAKGALQNQQLRKNLRHATTVIRSKRAIRASEVSNWEELRVAGEQIKNRLGRHLDQYLVQAEKAMTEAGITVHWARNAEEANQIVIDLARAKGTNEVVKIKSMATQEIELNEALEDAGIAAWETDLAELIVQLGHDRPSHILVPAIHRNRSEVREIFKEEMGLWGAPAPEGISDNPPELAGAARVHLREKFLRSKVAVSGGNFIVAETGSLVIVESEGNGRMCLTLPETLISVVGIEKLVPTWEDLEVFLRLLPRSSTGERMNPYTSIWTGVTPGDGPQDLHVILLDNGRTKVLMLSATVTGLILLPGSIAQALLMPVFGTLLDRRGGRFVVLPGTVFILISLLGMWLSFDATSRVWWLATLFGLFSAAGAAAMVSETYGLNALPRNLNPHGAAIMATLNPIAGALGAAFFVGVTHLGERLSASAAGGTTKTTASTDFLHPALELGQAGGQGAAIDTTAHAAATAGGALTEAARATMLDGLHLAFGLAPFVALLMLWAASRFHRKGQ